MIVAIVSFQMPKATTPEDMSGPFEAAVPLFQKVPGLLQKYFYVSDDGRRGGGVYVWAARAERGGPACTESPRLAAEVFLRERRRPPCRRRLRVGLARGCGPALRRGVEGDGRGQIRGAAHDRTPPPPRGFAHTPA